jgi:hypothetical protein
VSYLWKWSDADQRFLEYPTEIAKDEDFFYRGDFRLRHTPHTDPYLQTLTLEINPPEVKPSMTPLDETAKKARFERFEKLGLDRVKSDLTQTGGIRRMSHSEAGNFLRSVFANCTAANPPPTITINCRSGSPSPP